MTREELEKEANELLAKGWGKVQKPWRGLETVEAVENFGVVEARSNWRDINSASPCPNTPRLSTYARRADFTRRDFVDGTYRQVLEAMGVSAACSLNKLIAQSVGTAKFTLALLNGQEEPLACVVAFDEHARTATVACFCDVGVSAKPE